MTVGTQVRHIDHPEWFGQISVIGEDTEQGPFHPVQVQWGHNGGRSTGHNLYVLRYETFTEYLFMREGSFGKWDAWAGWWTHWMIAAVAIAAWWAAVPILAAVYIGHYLQFKGIFK